MRGLNLALGLASLVLALGLAEIAVRVLGVGPEFQIVFREIYEPSEDPELEYELRPGAPDGEDRISTEGLRDREFERSAPPGTFRIAAIGDSVTFGHGGIRSDAYPKRLEDLLRDHAGPGAPSYEVLNFGVTGYNTTQVVARLRSALAHEPDLVIYGYVLNDAQAFSFEGAALRDALAMEEEQFGAELSRGVLRWFAHSRLFLLAHHATMDLARYESGATGTLRGPGGEVSSRLDPAYVAVRAQGDRRGEYFRTLHRSDEGRARLESGLAELARLAGSRPAIVAIFPVFLGTARYPLRDVHLEIARQARRHGLEVVDLLPAYRRAATSLGGQALMDDFLHPSALGYRVAATALLEALVSKRLLPVDSVDLEGLRRSDGIEGQVAAAVLSPVSAARSGARAARSR